MSGIERPDDFESRRAHVRNLSDDQLHKYFWELADKIVEPLIEEAKTHTTPSIERSVLLRMGFSSFEAKALVGQMRGRGLLGHGAGHLILKVAIAKNLSVREAGEALIDGHHWEVLST
jgi:D-ornithine 4,5-aminomutase subunit alpha